MELDEGPEFVGALGVFTKTVECRTLARGWFQTHHSHVCDDVAVVQTGMAHVNKQRSELGVAGAVRGVTF